MNDKEREEAIDELADVCYECSGYGDDWYFDDDGNLEPACSDCWVQARLEALGSWWGGWVMLNTILRIFYFTDKM